MKPIDRTINETEYENDEITPTSSGCPGVINPVRITLKQTHQTALAQISTERQHGVQLPLQKVEFQPAHKETPKIHIIANGREGEAISTNNACQGITGIGKRKKNEDAILVTDDAIAVADGVGGYADGEKASEAAMFAVADYIYNRKIHLKQIFTAAIDEVGGSTMHENSGTTLAVTRKTKLQNGRTKFEVAHAGDTKILAFDLREMTLLYESTDQSIIQIMIDSTANSWDKTEPIERYTSEISNQLSSYVSAGGIHLPPEYDEFENTTGQTLIIVYSDGVSDFMSPEEIREEVKNLLRTNPGVPYQVALKNLPKILITTAVGRQGQLEGFFLRLDGILRKIEKSGKDNVSVTTMLA